jgi:hypothetical protein
MRLSLEFGPWLLFEALRHPLGNLYSEVFDLKPTSGVLWLMRSIGVLEYWSIGVMEYWSVGVLGCSSRLKFRVLSFREPWKSLSRKSTLGILLRSPDNDSRFFDYDFRAFFCQPAAQSDSGPLHKLEQ